MGYSNEMYRYDALIMVARLSCTRTNSVCNDFMIITQPCDTAEPVLSPSATKWLLQWFIYVTFGNKGYSLLNKNNVCSMSIDRRNFYGL